jgi:hypothetical protein
MIYTRREEPQKRRTSEEKNLRREEPQKRRTSEEKNLRRKRTQNEARKSRATDSIREGGKQTQDTCALLEMRHTPKRLPNGAFGLVKYPYHRYIQFRTFMSKTFESGKSV